MKKLLIGCAVMLVLTSIASAQLSQEWVARFNGLTNQADYGRAVAYDNAGNVYVTGYSQNYDSVQFCNSYDIVTVKYNSAGVQQWWRWWDGSGKGTDYPYAIAVNPATGDVYIAGYATVSTGYANMVALKYNTAGVLQWAWTYTGTSGTYGYGEDITYDASGNAYMAGYTYNTNSSVSSYDMELVKVNAAGVQWAVGYNGSANSSDYAYSVTMDNSGNIYMGGYIYNSSGYYDYCAVKYGPAGGAPLQVYTWNGPQNYADYGMDVEVDASLNVYMTGYSCYYTTSYNCGVTVKWNPTGGLLWATPMQTSYFYPTSYNYYAYYLKVTAAGNVYVAGYGYELNSSTVSYDLLCWLLNTSGGQVWYNHYNGPVNSSDYMYSPPGNCLAIDPAGNAYICGYATGTGSNYDYATVKFRASDGAQLWARTYDGGIANQDYPYWIAVDGANSRVFTTGYSYGVNSGITNIDFATVKYSNANLYVQTPLLLIGAFTPMQPANNQVYAGATYTVFDTIINNGLGNAFTVNTNCTFDVINNNQTITGYLTPGGASVATAKGRNTFTPTWTASTALGTSYNRKDTTYATSPIDTVLANNTATTSYQVVYDGQAVSIDYPTASTTIWCGASYTPLATVKNNSPAGTVGSFTVNCVITGGAAAYNNTQTVTNLGAGATYQVTTFPAWIASYTPNTPVSMTVTVQTANDYSTGNNTLTRTWATVFDGQVVSITDNPPNHPWTGYAYQPMATVKNLSTSGSATFNVTRYITPGYQQLMTVTGLGAGATQQLTFPSWTGSQVPNFAYADSVVIDRTGDNSTANNIMSRTVTMIYDGQAVSVDAPPDTLKTDTTYTPLATVKNNSPNGTSNFSVTCTITPGTYSQTLNTTLAANGQTQLTFPNWNTSDTAGITYTVTVTCQTPLDTDNTNNTRTKTCYVKGDVGAFDAVAPLDTVYVNSSYNPAARIKNFIDGTPPTGTTCPFPINCRIMDPSNLTIYSDVITDSLGPSQVKIETYKDWTVPPDTGIKYKIDVFTRMIGDFDTTNDHVIWTVVSAPVPSFDVGVASIDEPTGPVKQGQTITPKATIKNFGTSTATFDVMCVIGPDTSWKTVTSLARNISQQVTFKNWTASTVGNFTMFVKTLLSSDANHSNDTMSVAFAVRGIYEQILALPTDFNLELARPNPVSTSTSVNYALPVNTTVSLAVYDITGKLVKTLIAGSEAAGYKVVRWDGRDNTGRRVANGLYFVRMVTPKYTATGKIVLMR